jgi:hypothetical protein
LFLPEKYGESPVNTISRHLSSVYLFIGIRDQEINVHRTAVDGMARTLLSF